MDSGYTYAPARLGATFYAWLRARWAVRLAAPSAVVFALGVSLVWALAYNLEFWRQAIAAMWEPTPGAALFLVSLFLLVVCVQAILLLVAPTRVLMRLMASALFIVASVSSYFVSAYRALMNQDMLRNALQTDAAEVSGLINLSLLAHVLLLGVLPAVLVWRIALPASGWRTQLKQRAVFAAVALVVCAAGLFASSADFAVFLREHKPVRFALSPAAPVTSFVRLLSARKAHDPHQPLLDPGGDVQRLATPGSRPLVLFLVVGETARAANFQLGGYPRATNPLLSKVPGLVYFDHASSCGTSTAISVPCMFSQWPRARFDVDEADRYANVLDSLARGGVEVEWRDNNAGCKGVCARVERVSYLHRPDPQLCPNSYCYDEIMLTDLAARLDRLQHDTVMVFHAIGSHGPAYWERYPPQFEIFKPACRSNQLQDCSPEQIVNAYDNSIAYTDYALSRQIALLQAHAERIDSVLIYVSDHGESLGEEGIYLHGMPYAFAPRVQKEVPLLIWTSPGYAQRAGLRPDCMQAQSSTAVSHDNLYHTVLGAMELRNLAYIAALDLLFACRADRAGHE